MQVYVLDQIKINGLNMIKLLALMSFICCPSLGFLHFVVISENIVIYLRKPMGFA